jgi:two-component system, response regulator
MRDKTILLVEDNEDDVELTLRAFEKSKVASEIVVVRDGEAALEHLAVGGRGAPGVAALPALVLLDLKLPKIDGLGVLRALRADERTRLLPVIVLTSSREESDILSSYGLGANSFVRKPVDFARFVEATRQLGLYWLVLNEPPPQAPAHPTERRAGPASR